MICYRNVEDQEALWKYSLECLKDYISDEVLKELEEYEEKPAATPWEFEMTPTSMMYYDNLLFERSSLLFLIICMWR